MLINIWVHASCSWAYYVLIIWGKFQEPYAPDFVGHRQQFLTQSLGSCTPHSPRVLNELCSNKTETAETKSSENLSQFQKYFRISHANEWCETLRSRRVPDAWESQLHAGWGQRDGWWQQRLGKLIACRTFSGSLRSTWFMDKSWEVTHPTLTLTMTSAEECRQEGREVGSNFIVNLEIESF